MECLWPQFLKCFSSLWIIPIHFSLKINPYIKITRWVRRAKCGQTFTEDLYIMKYISQMLHRITCHVCHCIILLNITVYFLFLSKFLKRNGSNNSWNLPVSSKHVKPITQNTILHRNTAWAHRINSMLNMILNYNIQNLYEERKTFTFLMSTCSISQELWHT